MDILRTEISVPDIIKVADICVGTKQRTVPVFEGGSGIGKTWQARQFAAMRKMELIELNCSTLFPEDFGAIRDSNGYVEFMLNRMFDVRGATLFFVDEFSRSKGDLRNVIMALINERKIYGTKISDLIHFLVAMNPCTEEYGDTEDPWDDLATIRRYSVFTVKERVEHWLAWAKKFKVSEQTRSFIASNKPFLTAGQACPRQWVKLDEILQRYGVEGVQLFGKGTVGTCARAYIDYIGGQQIVTIGKVINKYATVRDEVLDDKELQLMLGTLLVQETLNNKHKRNIIMFLKDLNEEIRYKIILDLIESGKSSDKVQDWVDNSTELSDFMEKQSQY